MMMITMGMRLRSSVLLLSFAVLTLVSSSSSSSTHSTAKVYTVGDNSGWVVNPLVSYQVWSATTKVRVHDKLVFKYTKGKDLVLQVRKEDYMKCNRKSPLKKMSSGNTWVEFGSPGKFYFISGKKDHCQKGQKLQVEVKSADTNRSPPVIPIRSDHPSTPPAVFTPPIVSYPSLIVTSDAAPAPSPSRSSSLFNNGVIGFDLFVWAVVLVVMGTLMG